MSQRYTNYQISEKQQYENQTNMDMAYSVRYVPNYELHLRG